MSLTPVPLDHPTVQLVEPQIFLYSFAPDCMTHECRCGTPQDGTVLLDACCRHGCDVDLFERDAILRRAAAIAPVLRPEFRDTTRWFKDDEAEPDTDCPSGILTRTGRVTPDEDSGCVFLQHDGRGCALHRAALQHGFDPAEIKPQVCRLYPLSFGEGLLGLSDDFDLYSCAHYPESPSVYQVTRVTVAEVFGWDVVRALDRMERNVVRRRLPVSA
jgi:hypothetical protein